MAREPVFDVSVIIATHNRAACLENAIESIEREELSDINCELIVVDNGSTDHTATVLSKQWDPIPVNKIYERSAGKSRALNRALAEARGTLVVFTDDDVTVSVRWLAELWRVAQVYKEETVFCGPIIPCYPDETPLWLRMHRLAPVLFARFEPILAEGPLPFPMAPFGPNFAVRGAVAKRLRFRTDLGPSVENGPLLGEDTAFVNELRIRHGVFTDLGGFIYVPTAPVQHHIAKNRIEFSAMMERFFNLGRTRVIARGGLSHLNGRPRLLIDHSLPDEAARLMAGAELNFYCGQFYQCRCIGHESDSIYLRELLEKLLIHKRKDLLSPTVKELFDHSSI